MKITQEQLDTLNLLCIAISKKPNTKANLILIGNFKQQRPVVKIVENNSTYVITDSNCSNVINDLNNFV